MSQRLVRAILVVLVVVVVVSLVLTSFQY